MAALRLPEWFERAQGGPCPRGGHGRGPGFIDKTLSGITAFIRDSFENEGAKRPGLLQRIDPRARIAGVLALLAASAVTRNPVMLGAMYMILSALAALSFIGLKAVFKRVLPSFLFTLMIIFPVFLNIVSPGREIAGIGGAGLRLSITEEGAAAGLFFLARFAVMASFAALLLLSTRQADFFRGLSGLPIPRLFTTALFMAFRYLFVLLKIAEDSALARKSRTFGKERLVRSQAWFASRAVFFLKRSMNIADEVNMAMISRGFAGRLSALPSEGLKARDYAWAGAAAFVLFLAIGI